MKPHIHAESSAKHYGGVAEDYIEIHKFMDWSKSALADVRHRAIFHSAFGIYIVERVFGETITNSNGKKVSVRDIAERHVIEDLGFIPSLEKWLDKLPIEDWMISQSVKKEKNNPEPISNEDAQKNVETDILEEFKKNYPWMPTPMPDPIIPLRPYNPKPYEYHWEETRPYIWPIVRD